jgi:hypothetical protein
MKTYQTTYRKYDPITRRWWFFAGLVLLQLLPPFTSKGFNFNEMYEIVSTTLNRGLFFSCQPVFPVFQGIAISVLVLLMAFRNKVRVVFAIHAGFSYLLFAVMQMTAVTPRYGLSVLSGGVLVFGLVAAAWFWEGFCGSNDFSAHKRPPWKYVVIVPAIFAFWMPLDLETFGPDLDLANFITSGSALTFCMMTPVYLAVLIFFYPMVNIVVLRVTSAVAIFFAIYNVPMLLRSGPRWNGVLHLPLLILSVLGLILSMRRVATER